MTPPIFNLDDEVEIIGARCDGQMERIGERFRISQYHVDQNDERCSAIGFPWYPASSLRLVEEKPLSPMHVTYDYKPDDYEHGTFQVSCPCGRKAEIDPEWRKVDEELKIGDWVRVVGPAGNGSDFSRGYIFQISEKSPIGEFSTKKSAWYPASSLRKLTPEEIQQYQTAQMLPKPTEIQELRRRIHDLEMSLDGFTNGPEPEYVSGFLHVKDPIRKRLSVIEARLGNIDRILEDHWELHTQWRDRLSAIESRLNSLAPSHTELMGDVEALAEKMSAMQKEIDVLKGEMPEVCEGKPDDDLIHVRIYKGSLEACKCAKTESEIIDFVKWSLDSMREG